MPREEARICGVTSGNGVGRQGGELLSTSEAGHVLGVSRWTVRRMVQEGDLDAVEVHGMLRVSRESLRRYIAQHTYRDASEERGENGA